MKKVFAGLIILSIALVALFTIVDLEPYLAPKNRKPEGTPVQPAENKPEEILDPAREPRDGGEPLTAPAPEDLVTPPADDRKGPMAVDAPAPAAGVKEEVGALPADTSPAQSPDSPGNTGTDNQAAILVEPKQAEVFGLLTDTGETEENRLMDQQSAQTAVIAAKQREKRTKASEPQQLIHEVANQAITIVPEGTYPFAILLETLANKENAEKAIALYRKQHLSCYWTRVDLDNPGIKYRLFTGVFPSRAAAQTFLTRHRLAGKPIKPTVYAARIGTFQDKNELAAAFAKTAAAGVSPYTLGTETGTYFLYVGAFYTADGSESQCRDLIGKGLPCKSTTRSTLSPASH